MQGGGDLISSILPLIILFGIFYVFVIMPQQKQAKKHKEMLSSLTRGDKIVTAGGLIAEIVKTEEDFIKIKLSDEVIVKLNKEYVAKKIEDEVKA